MVLPSENILCLGKTGALDIIIPKGLLKFFICCGSYVTEFNTKKWHTAARCSVLQLSWLGPQTSDTSCTYSTLRHCTTMPLQVGMEEGPMSKGVRVRGLQYCQYS
jgi:hypothetical protein